jgi:hypothetical protein
MAGTISLFAMLHSLHLLGHEKHFLLSQNVYVLSNDLRKKPCPSQTNEYCTRTLLAFSVIVEVSNRL